jgi:DNA-binding winged helix-turn-helix (wHTH) protein
MIHAFGDYELDTERFELRRKGERHHVEPQVFDVLVYLIEHRDRVVGREELLAQVWGHSFVSEATLSSRLMAARKAIGDSGRAQALIRTVRGRGYQFVGEVKRDGELAPAQPAPARAMFGRDRELDRLHEELEAARSGARRTVFVTGEAGAGKTTLVEAFLARAGDNAALLRARGFCLEHRGTGEPYMPVLEALGRLCGERAGAPLREALAPARPHG